MTADKDFERTVRTRMPARTARRLEPDLPLYRQVSRGDLVLHLSEHHGDSTPGSVVYVYMRGVADLHEELRVKAGIGHNNPGLETGDGRTEFSVTDPFGNRLRFGEIDE